MYYICKIKGVFYARIYFNFFFGFAVDGEECDGEKPVVLWAVYFNRKCFMPKASDNIPENVKLTSLPSSQLDFEDAMKEVLYCMYISYSCCIY